MMAMAAAEGNFVAEPSCSSPKTWSDEELLLEYRVTGKQQLFAILVQRYEQELFSYLCRYLGDEQLAEDTFQTTFLHVHLKRDQFDSGRKVRPWLYRIATNRAIDNIRRRRRRATISLDAPCDPTDPDSGTWIDLVQGDCQSPDSRLIQKEKHGSSIQALHGLPEHLRQVVMLVYFQNMKYREAADVLSIPVGTVKSRMHTAISKLQETMTRT